MLGKVKMGRIGRAIGIAALVFLGHTTAYNAAPYVTVNYQQESLQDKIGKRWLKFRGHIEDIEIEVEKAVKKFGKYFEGDELPDEVKIKEGEFEREIDIVDYTETPNYTSEQVDYLFAGEDGEDVVIHFATEKSGVVRNIKEFTINYPEEIKDINSRWEKDMLCLALDEILKLGEEGVQIDGISVSNAPGWPQYNISIVSIENIYGERGYGITSKGLTIPRVKYYTKKAKLSTKHF